MSEHQPIQDLSFEQYQAAAGVSNSMLKVIRESTPLHLMWQMKNKPEPTAAQRMGSLVHAAILTPDIVPEFAVRPRGMDLRTKAGKEWQEAQGDKPVLTADESAAIDAMKASVHKHPVASKLLKNATFERSLFVTDAKGTLRKLRPDVLPDGGNVLPDLKTCESAHPDEFSKAIANYGYYGQAAYYIDGTALAGREYELFAFIAVEKHPPYACAVYTLDPVAVDFGRRLYERDLQVYRECILKNEWPGYGDTATCISLPPWLQKEMEQLA